MYIRASAPDAPPLSETTTGCFISPFFWMAACIIRAIWSEAPPAPAATTISTALVGSHAAGAGAAAKRRASVPPRPVDSILDIVFSLIIVPLFRLIRYKTYQAFSYKTPARTDGINRRFAKAL